MSRPARSILAFAVYMLGLGLALLIAPNALLAPVGWPNTSEVWIRVLGMVVLLLAFYYLQAALLIWLAAVGHCPGKIKLAGAAWIVVRPVLLASISFIGPLLLADRVLYGLNTAMPLSLVYALA